MDLDNDGAKALAAIEHSSHVPHPSYVISSSPGNYQVIWKVNGITQEQAESLQRRMVQEFGADPAATDSARVLRLPAFSTRNTSSPSAFQPRRRVPCLMSSGTSSFRRIALVRSHVKAPPLVSRQLRAGGRGVHLDDWNWATRRLDRGESIEALVQKLTDYRDDKPNPGYYARRTVTRAYAHVALSRGEAPQEVMRAISEHPPRPYDNGDQYARTVVEETLAKLSRSKIHEVAAPSQVYQHSQQLALGVSR